MPPDPVFDEAVVNSLATVQSQLNTLQIQIASTPTPASSWSVYAVPVSSPTNVINLRVDHSVSIGDLMVSVFIFLGLFIVILRLLFNGLRGNTL